MSVITCSACALQLSTITEILVHNAVAPGHQRRMRVIGESAGYGRMRLTPAWRAAGGRKRKAVPS